VADERPVRAGGDRNHLDGGRDTAEQRSWAATIKALPWARAGVVVGVLGVVIAIVFGVAAACSTDEPPPPGPSQSGNGNVNCGDGATCDVDIEQVQNVVRQAVDAAGDDTELREELRADPGAGEPPSGKGPYPFLVVDTGDLGLYARTGNEVQAARVGNTANHALVWADCATRSDFTPGDVSGETDVGPLWVEVRWKHLDGGQSRGLSEPDESQRAWMYRGALEPVGHNGDLPEC
jgi:hypothetical protein